MPFAEGVSEVLAALSKEWLTEEELAAPVEEPEEWTPEVRLQVIASWRDQLLGVFPWSVLWEGGGTVRKGCCAEWRLMGRQVS
jgi:hypothetical protein